MLEIFTNDKVDRQLGCIYGAFIGDAIGAHTEFSGTPTSRQRAQNAISLIGGGPHGTAPGQITDDSEMAIGLMRSIAVYGDYDPSSALEEYRDWYNSGPFDMGGTTSGALRADKWEIDHQFANQIDSHLKRVASLNKNSQANGALMRLSPLVAYGAGAYPCNQKKGREMARKDARLTHPHPVCTETNAIYYTIGEMLIMGHSPQDAIDEILRDDCYEQDASCQIILGWVKDAVDGKIPTVDGWDCGWVGVAFQVAVYYLLKVGQGMTYTDAMREIAQLGGDADTNAAIAGGLLGAYIGKSGLPQEMVDKIDYCDTSKGRQRPIEWQTKENMHFAEAVVFQNCVTA